MGFWSRIFRRREQRAYAAASINPQTMSDWIMSPLSADAELVASNPRLRARARQLERDSDIVEAYLADVENNVVGPDGFRLQMRVTQRQGGKNVADVRANECIEYHWARQCATNNFLVSGDTAEPEADRLIIRSVMRDGGALIRFVRGVENDYGFALQLIEEDCIDEEYSGIAANGNEVRMGIELDSWRRVTAVYVKTRHPGDFGFAARSGNVARERVPAGDCLYAYLKKRIGQTRGVTALAPVMLRIRMLDGYIESELIAARAAAAKMGFLTKEQATDGKLAPQECGPDGKPKKEPAGTYMSGKPGTIEMLPAGYNFQSWDPQHPVQQFGEFVRNTIRRISAGLKAAYHKIANDYSDTSYSSLREAKLVERDHWLSMQGWFIRTVKMRVFREWLRYALLAGKITDLDTGTPLPASKFEPFSAAVFRGRRWGWVDPVKEQQANVIARKMGWKSDRDIVEEQGGDIEETYDQIADDEELARKKNIIVGNVQMPAVSGAADDSAAGDAPGRKPKAETE